MNVAVGPTLDFRCYCRSVNMNVACSWRNIGKFCQTIGIAPTLREPRLDFLDCHNSRYF